MPLDVGQTRDHGVARLSPFTNPRETSSLAFEAKLNPATTRHTQPTHLRGTYHRMTCIKFLLWRMSSVSWGNPHSTALTSNKYKPPMQICF